MQKFLKLFYYLLIGGIWIWSLGILHFFAPLKVIPFWLLSILWIGLAVLLYLKTATNLKLRYSLPAIVLILPLSIWFAQNPGNISKYRSEQSKLTTGLVNGQQLSLKNLRSCRLDKEGKLIPQWYDLDVDLDSLISLDYFIVHFSGWKGIAHTFLSFGFASGEYIAVSVEARRAHAVPYGLLPGLYHQFDLMYLLGDEADIVGIRSLRETEPVYMLPINTPIEKMQQLLVNIVLSANKLNEQPEFYNTLISTCTTQLALQANKLRKEDISLWDWRLIFPGYSGDLAIEAGLLDLQGPMDAQLEKFRVPAINARTLSRQEFSSILHKTAKPKN
jgi:hypothetical protein